MFGCGGLRTDLFAVSAPAAAEQMVFEKRSDSGGGFGAIWNLKNESGEVTGFRKQSDSGGGSEQYGVWKMSRERRQDFKKWLNPEKKTNRT